MRRTSWIIAIIVGGASAIGAPTAWAAESLRVSQPLHESVRETPPRISSTNQPVRIDIAKGSRLHRATLNGRSIEERLERAEKALTGTVGSRHGLRAGANTLVVESRTARGRPVVEVSRFTLAMAESRLSSLKVGGGASGAADVRITTSQDDAQLAAGLNGRSVRNAFRQTQTRRLVARLNASHGLRHGDNLLRTRTTVGALTKLTTKKITVPEDTTIAGPGLDVRVTAGKEIALDGSGSIPPVGSRKSALRYVWTITSKPRHSRPKLFRAHAATPALRTDVPGEYTLRLTVGAAGPRGQTLAQNSGSSASSATVTVDATGDPLVPIDTMASATSNGGSATNGIRLGIETATTQCGSTDSTRPCFYPSPSDEELQVLALDRVNLEPSVDASYDLSDANDVVAFETAIGGLDEDDFVALVYRSSDLTGLGLGSTTASPNLITELPLLSILSELGVDTADFTGGPISVIGIPGMSPGRAWTNFGNTLSNAAGGGESEESTPENFCAMDPDYDASTQEDSALGVQSEDDPVAGQLKGYLRPIARVKNGLVDQRRVFNDATIVQVDTRAETSSTSNTVEIGAVAHKQDVKPTVTTQSCLTPDGTTPGINPDPNITVNCTTQTGQLPEQGFQFIEFDPITMKVTTKTSFEPGDWSGLGDTLSNAASANRGVALVSLASLTDGSTNEDGAFTNTLLPALERLGANPDVFARAVNADREGGNGAYSLVASGGVAVHSSAVMQEGLDPSDQEALSLHKGRLTATLHRGSDGRMYPATSDPNGVTDGSPLLPVAYQDEVSWPCTPADGTTPTGTEIALAYLAQEAFKLDDSGDGQQVIIGSDGSVKDDAVRQVILDLREEYQSLSASLESSAVDEAASNADLTDKPFTSAQLSLAQQQLDAEIQDRDGVLAFIGALAEPFESSQSSQVESIQSSVQNVASDVLEDAAAQIPETSGFTAGTFADVMNGLGRAASFFKEASPAAGQFGLALTFVSGVTEAIVALDETNDTDPLQGYVLLESELEDDEVDAATQVTDSISSQYTATIDIGQMLLQDRNRMSTVRDLATNDWNITAADVSNMWNAIQITSRQQAYRAFVLTLYRGAEVPDASKPSSLTCTLANTDDTLYEPTATDDYKPFSNAEDDKVVPGLGGGSEYYPLTSPSTTDNTMSYVAYQLSWADVSNEDDSTTSSGSAATSSKAASSDVFAQLEDQPEIGDSDSLGAGFYMPDFWFDNFDLSWQVYCPSDGADPDSRMYWVNKGAEYTSG